MSTILRTGGRLTGGSVVALVATMEAHALARDSVLNSDVGKYEELVDLVLLKLLVPPS